MSYQQHRWNLHVCLLDPECRKYAGWCWRIEFSTPWWHLGVALRPGDRYVRMDGSSYWISFRRWPR